MERTIPKNVRQIGNVSDSTKVYMEDYVDTFLNQLCEKVDDSQAGAFLVGEVVKQEGQEHVYIHGAVKMKETKLENNEIVIDGEIWKSACEDCKTYFGEGEILGWYLAGGGQPPTLVEHCKKIHQKWFKKENSIFIRRDVVEKEDQFYTYKYNDLMELSGHYIYYEKNPSMQNYMITTRKKIGVTPSEAFEDRAAKDFRAIIQEKMEHGNHKPVNKLTYAASTFLVLVVLVIGITTINNYDKMQSVQSSLDTISQSVMKEDEPTETASADYKLIQNTAAEDTQEETTKGSGKDKTKSGDDEDDAVAANGTVINPEDMASGDIYVVEKGDTLATISKKVYGDISHVDAICKTNGLQDGNLIYIGQKLLLP